MYQWKTRKELEHKVVTLSVQGMTRRAIARSLRVSRNTVRKILVVHFQARQEKHNLLTPPAGRTPRPNQLDAWSDRIADLLARLPEITAQRVYEEIRDAGYAGGYTAVKRHVRRVRPPAKPEPSLPTPIVAPGEMAECDWSPYTIDFTNGERVTVQSFNYVLKWSKRKYFGLYERCDFFALLDGHVKTFERFEGAAHACKYDNQKTVVLGWEGAQPIYNPRFLAFATHYQFRPVACRPLHPNDKPRTERSHWEFERSFLNGRRFRDLPDMRAQLVVWLDGTADVRPHKKTKRPPIEAFAEEKPTLLPLPAHPYDTARVLYRVCSIDGFIAFDGNRYAIPYEHVTDILPVRVTQAEIFIYAADLKLVARHGLVPRGARLDVTPPDMHRPTSRRSAADLDQLERTFCDLGEIPALFFAGLRITQDRSAGHHARQILLLRERYSTSDLVSALAHARAFGAFECHAVERILAARARPRRLAEYVADDAARRFADPPGTPDTYLHDIEAYDRLPVASPVPPQETTPCPDESPRKKTPSNGSDDTSNSSD